MTEDIVIIGAGGFGREVADVIDAINAESNRWNLLGFVDDGPSDIDRERIASLGHTLLGGADVLKDMSGIYFTIGIGSGATREIVASKAESAGLAAATLVHPSATVGAQVDLAPGVILCSGARLTTNITLGRHVHVNLNSTIGHDTTIEDFVTINPLVAVSGNCVLRARSNLGTHASTIPGITVGEDATVGAASCVTRNVPASTLVKGVPAR